MGKDLAANKFKQGPQQRLQLQAGKLSTLVMQAADGEVDGDSQLCNCHDSLLHPRRLT